MDTFGLKVGDAVFVRCAVFHYTGRVKSIANGAVELVEAAWIADSGRWHDALMTGKLLEVEPEPHGISIPLQSICDWRPWQHELPVNQI